MERIQDQHRKNLDEIYLLFKFIIDKNEGKGEDIEQPYAWFVHKLFKEGGEPNYGKFNEQIFMLPVSDQQPIDPKKMKKLLVKFEYEINEDMNKGG